MTGGGDLLAGLDGGRKAAGFRNRRRSSESPKVLTLTEALRASTAKS